MGVEESFTLVQTVEFLTVVARNRETCTCTVGQIVVVVAMVARRDTSTRIAAVVAINQDPVYTGKYCLHGSGQILSPYTTRLRGTVQILLQYSLYKSVQIFASLSFGMAF